jgi:hypothetical protein
MVLNTKKQLVGSYIVSISNAVEDKKGSWPAMISSEHFFNAAIAI